MHTPHQVDRYWSDQYKGKFDRGWDAYRVEVFERQKMLGVIPANAKLPERIALSNEGFSGMERNLMRMA